MTNNRPLAGYTGVTIVDAPPAFYFLSPDGQVCCHTVENAVAIVDAMDSGRSDISVVHENALYVVHLTQAYEGPNGSYYVQETGGQCSALTYVPSAAAPPAAHPPEVFQRMLNMLLPLSRPMSGGASMQPVAPDTLEYQMVAEHFLKTAGHMYRVAEICTFASVPARRRSLLFCLFQLG